MDNPDPRITRNGKKILIDNIPIGEWAKNKGIKSRDFIYQLSKNLTVDEAIAQYSALCERKLTVFFDGKTWTIKELLNSEHNKANISYRIYYGRVIIKKWDIARALSEPVKEIKREMVYYNGKTYRSASHLCLTLGIEYGYFRRLINEGLTIEETINRALGVVSIDKKYLYKGKEYTVRELAAHPDNIHGIHKKAIYNRLKANKTSTDTLFAPLSQQGLKSAFSFTYKGITYKSRIDFMTKHNLTRSEYDQLLGVDVKSKDLEEFLDKLLAKSKNK